MALNEYGMLSMSKQSGLRSKSGKVKKPEDYFSPSGTRNKWYRAHSKVELTDDLHYPSIYATTNTDSFRVGRNNFKPPERVLRGSVCKTLSTVDLNDHETGSDVFHSTAKEAHFNHGKSLEKVVYPYRNASQIELGKDPLNYSQTSQAEYATDRFKYGPAPSRTSCLRNKSQVNIGFQNAPYVSGLPIMMRMSMPDLDPAVIRGRKPAAERRPATAAVHVGSKAGPSGTSREMSSESATHQALEEKAGKQEDATPEGNENDPGVDEQGEGQCNEDQENVGEEEDVDEGAEAEESYADVVNREYTDHYHSDQLLPSTLPPHRIIIKPAPDRVLISRGSVNKMASQISIGWTSQPVKYVSHEHSAFKKLEVKKFVPLDHVRTQSKVPLKYQPTTPENYISVTKEAFQDVSDYIGDEALGCRIMGGKRGEHTVNFERGLLDGHIKKTNKYSDDFPGMATKDAMPSRVTKGKTISQVELKKQDEEDPWELNPKSMYETASARDFGAKPQPKLHQTPKDFRFRSQVNLRHPILNKNNIITLYQQREERQQQIEMEADAARSGK